MNHTTAKISSVTDFIQLTGLNIPDYQRPYKWQDHHVNHLLDDILHQQGRSAYRLGTVVIHEHDSYKQRVLDIVDGQQRTITLLLIIKAFIKQLNNNEKKLDKQLTSSLETISESLPDFKFSNHITQHNIIKNYQLIYREIKKPEYDSEVLSFLLHKCEFVVITLNDISEAFQFFDAQNARGKDLSPHDLLKAYHLREFSDRDGEYKAGTVAQWENTDSDQLAILFGDYLYRIRGWANGKSARFFTKDNIDDFKGVNLDTDANLPFIQSMQITHRSVDDYNKHYMRDVDKQSLSYPFQLDQVIINGRRFFEMINHYQAMRNGIQNQTYKKLNSTLGADLSQNAQDILEAIDNYEGKYRIGDSYIRTLFNAILLYYIDKFGLTEISSAIEKCFIWAYSIRLNYQRLEFASVDNEVNKNNLFQKLRFAMHPVDFLHISLSGVDKIKASKVDKISYIFKAMGYADDK